MAKIYAAPEHIKRPEINDFINNYDAYDKAGEKYVDDIKAFCKENSKCPHAGEEIRFQIADGYARYAVFDYRSLIHLDVGDAYDIPDAYARGLRKDDILKAINRAKGLSALFGRSNAA